MITLGVVTAQALKHPELRGGLHPLRHHRHTQGASHLHRGRDDLGASRVVGQLGDERSIHLELIQREALQVAERRVPGPEIV